MTNVTEISWMALDSLATYAFIDKFVAADAQSGDIQTDFKKALIAALSLSGGNYSLDDLWKRYQLSTIVTSDGDVEGGPSRTPPKHTGQHAGHFLPPSRLRNPDNLTPYPGAAGDEFIGDVIFLASFDGGSGETFTPEIGPNFEWWKNGSGTQPTDYDGKVDTAEDKFGGVDTAALYMKETAGAPSAGWQTVSATTTGDFYLPGDFTIEGHFKYTTCATDFHMLSLWDFTTRMWRLYIDLGQRVNFTMSTTGSDSVGIFNQETVGGAGMTVGQWYHIAICREGNNWHCFVDGAYTDGPDLGTKTQAVTPFNATSPYLCIGEPGRNDGAGAIEGWVDNLRVTKGVARYTAPFTPPSAPFPTS